MLYEPSKTSTTSRRPPVGQEIQPPAPSRRRRQRDHHEGDESHADHHQQQFFQEHPAPRSLADLEKLHRAPVDDVVPLAVQQVDDRRDQTAASPASIAED